MAIPVEFDYQKLKEQFLCVIQRSLSFNDDENAIHYIAILGKITAEYADRSGQILVELASAEIAKITQQIDRTDLYQKSVDLVEKMIDRSGKKAK